jgi:hypothetical protein
MCDVHFTIAGFFRSLFDFFLFILTADSGVVKRGGAGTRTGFDLPGHPVYTRPW